MNKKAKNWKNQKHKKRKPVFRIRIHMFWGLMDPDPDPLVRGMDPEPAPDPDPSIIKQK